MKLHLAVVSGLIACSLTACADTLASALGSNGYNVAPYYFGQSFTVNGAGPFDDVSFNYLAWRRGGAIALIPYAIGMGYLFSQAYVGSPEDLGSSSPGLLGTGQAVNGLYQFDSSLVLTGGQMYYFYEDTAIPMMSVSGSASYAGGLTFFTASGSTPFAASSTPTIAAENFMVTGSALPASTAVTPEPSGFVLLGTGIVALAGMARRRFA